MEVKMKLDKKTLQRLGLGLAGLILFAWCLDNNKVVFRLLGTLVGMLAPFLIGLVIAFILNVPMRALERGLFRGARARGRPAWRASR